MKENDKSRNILMAISIGLTAAMALMPNATAYAAEGEGEPESIGNESSQESSQSESTESQATESMSEVSESVAEAAEEMAQSEAPAAAEVSGAFSETAEIIADIAGDMGELDQAYAEADEQAEYFSDMEYAASLSSDHAESIVEEAEESVAAAATSAESTLTDANTAKSEVETQAGATYENEAEAASAKEESEKKLDEVKTELAQSQTAVETAQGKLETAERSLSVAEEAVEHAANAKETADKAVDETKTKLISLLEENGISYTEDAEGNIEVDQTAEISDGKIKSAIDKAQAAAEKANSDAKAAASDLATANANALKAAQSVADTAAENAKTAKAEYDEKVAAFTEDTELEDLLQQIATAKSAVAKTVEENKGTADYYDANRNLAFNIVKYILYQDPTIDRSSIVSTNYDKNGNVAKVKINSGKESAVEISFRRIGSSVTEYRYFDYNAYYRDGSKIGTKNHNGVKDADHIIVVEKKATDTDADGRAKSFGGSQGDVFFSELGIDKGTDAYQSSKAAVSQAEIALAEATDRESQTKAALQTYGDLAGAKIALNNAQTALDDAQNSFTESFQNNERLEELISLIKSQQENIKNVNGSTAFYEQNRILTFYMIEYALLQQGNVDPASIDIARKADGKIDWVNKNGAQNHYCTVTYRLQGSDETVTAYFDYIVYFEDGETAGDSDTSTNFNRSNVVDKENGKKIDHILVVKKQLSTSGPTMFDGKGEAFFDEADFNAGADAYQSGKNKIVELKQAVSDAQSAVDVAENIQLLKDKASAAESLSVKVEEARQKVNAAASALKQARTTAAMNKDKLAELTQQLADARAEYDQAVKELDAAKDKVAQIQSIVDELTGTIGAGFTNIKPAQAQAAGGSLDSAISSSAVESSAVSSSAGGTSTSAAETGTSDASVSGTGTVTDTTGGAASMTAGSGTAATSGAADVLGDRHTPAVGAAASTTSDLEVLGDRQAPMPAGDDMLEEGVLGARQSPIIEAYENGTFARGMLFNEDGLKLSFTWWLVILILGGKGVQMYAKSRRKEEETGDTGEH
jgi:hypothetical protein